MIPGYQISGHQRWPIEQGYKQVKDELGWADFQVRSDIAIRRHPPRRRFPEPATGRGGPRPAGRPSRRAGPGRSGHSAPGWPMDHAAALVDRLVERAPAPAAVSPDQLDRGRLGSAPLHPN